MNEMYKELIKKYRGSQIIDGYKYSELGLIPCEWNVYTIMKLVEEGILHRPMDGNHGAIHPTAKDYVESGIPFLLATDIRDDIINLKSCKFLKKEQADRLQKGFALRGDVLLTHKGSVGNVALVPEINSEYIMLTPQVTYYRIKDYTRLSNKFLKVFMQSEEFQKYLKLFSKGATRDYIGWQTTKL